MEPTCESPQKQFPSHIFDGALQSPVKSKEQVCPSGLVDMYLLELLLWPLDTLKKQGVIVSSDCQLRRMLSYLGDEALGLSVKEFLGQVN